MTEAIYLEVSENTEVAKKAGRFQRHWKYPA